MAPGIAHREADGFAHRAVEAAAQQRVEWGVQLKPWLHNGMVNMGLKPAGLCYEWANALYGQLNEEVPPGLRMTLVQSSAGKMREHHAISLHDHGDRWSEGILLDGWQEAGLLVYMPIRESEREWVFEAEKPYSVRPKPFHMISKAIWGGR